METVALTFGGVGTARALAGDGTTVTEGGTGLATTDMAGVAPPLGTADAHEPASSSIAIDLKAKPRDTRQILRASSGDNPFAP